MACGVYTNTYQVLDFTLRSQYLQELKNAAACVVFACSNHRAPSPFIGYANFNYILRAFFDFVCTSDQFCHRWSLETDKLSFTVSILLTCLNLEVSTDVSLKDIGCDSNPRISTPYVHACIISLVESNVILCHETPYTILMNLFPVARPDSPLNFIVNLRTAQCIMFLFAFSHEYHTWIPTEIAHVCAILTQRKTGIQIPGICEKPKSEHNVDAMDKFIKDRTNDRTDEVSKYVIKLFGIMIPNQTPTMYSLLCV